MSHTPGPWTHQDAGFGQRSVHEPNGRCVCLAKPEDAPLIAAAPELLAMLKRLEWAGRDRYAPTVEACPVCGDSGGFHAPDCELSALLTKAEGK